MRNEMNDITRHIAGATVSHKSPFLALSIPKNTSELSSEFIQKWVLPFYLTDMASDSYLNSYLVVRKALSIDVLITLLGDFNWRPRTVAADFAALENLQAIEESIGHLLLRSEVCYAGAEYCLALASFNTKKSFDFLREYLDYYLKQKDLYFDQGAALGAIAYLDDVNETQIIAEMMPAWINYVKNKPHLSSEKSIQFFKHKMNVMFALQQKVHSQPEKCT